MVWCGGERKVWKSGGRCGGLAGGMVVWREIWWSGRKYGGLAEDIAVWREAWWSRNGSLTDDRVVWQEI